MNESCENCKFFHRYDDNKGECHRYAPRPRMIDFDDIKDDTTTEWPPVYQSEWCGEWKQADEKT